ncbi:MAG: 30S ribosome-binding factor RbfA [Oscillospiraceae bacterium]|jgi:ribosome-binding factor A|nr:30S ribosome-binding factor RbfA [Oscillospiraceae bacterium]
MSVHKIDRISSDIKREISFILRDLNNPQIQNLVSVVRIYVTSDLAVCRVYLSIMGDEKSSRKTFRALESASGFVRRELALRLKLRRTPEIKFLKTNSIEYGAKLEKIFKEI